MSKVPHGHWQTTTLIAALGLEGVRCSTVVDGAVNADVFEAMRDCERGPPGAAAPDEHGVKETS